MRIIWLLHTGNQIHPLKKLKKWNKLLKFLKNKTLICLVKASSIMKWMIAIQSTMDLLTIIPITLPPMTLWSNIQMEVIIMIIQCKIVWIETLLERILMIGYHHYPCSIIRLLVISRGILIANQLNLVNREPPSCLKSEMFMEAKLAPEMWLMIMLLSNKGLSIPINKLIFDVERAF